MSLDFRQERQQAHALIDLLPPSKLGAVRNLLEVFRDDDTDSFGPSEAEAIAEADEWSKHNESLSHEKVLASSDSPSLTGRKPAASRNSR